MKPKAILLTGLLAASFLGPAPSQAAAPAGTVDVKLSSTGTYNPGILNIVAQSSSVTLTATNDANTGKPGSISTTATNIVVQAALDVDGAALTLAPSSVPAGTTYANGTWTISSLAPGASASLTFNRNAPALLSTAHQRVVAQVISQGQVDLDSAPNENADIGDQDDETIFEVRSGGSALGGTITNDANRNGLRDTGEPGTPTMVTLSSGTRRVYANESNTNGGYSYPFLVNGSTTVRVTPPSGFSPTTQGVGADRTIDSDVDAAGSVTLTTGAGTNRTVDAGLVASADLSVTHVAAPTTGTIPLSTTHTITVTNSGTGATAPTVSSLIPGVVTTSTPSVGTASRSGDVTTWVPGLLLPGTSATLTLVVRLDAAGTTTNRTRITSSPNPDPDSTPQPVTTACSGSDDCAQVNVTAQAPAPLTGTIQGILWIDTNGDGQRQSTEPLQSGVAVQAGSASTVTNSLGAYTLSVPAGSTTVRVTLPPDTSFTTKDAGPDTTDSDIDSSGLTVNVTAGGVLSIDAGLRRVSTPRNQSGLTVPGRSVTIDTLGDANITGRTTTTLPGGFSWRRTSGAAWGSVSCTPGGLCTYAPTGDHVGTDTFTFELISPTFGASTQTVTVATVQQNRGPTANDDSARTTLGQSVTVNVLANDTDPDQPLAPVLQGNSSAHPGDTLTITNFGAVSGPGTVTCTGSTCTLTPTGTGEASFTYTIRDGGPNDPRATSAGLGVPAQTSSATVRVRIDSTPAPLGGFTGRGSITAPTSSAVPQTSVPVVAASCVNARAQVSLSWGAVRATSHTIQRRLATPLAGQDTDWIVVGNTAGTSLVDTLIGEGVTYQYRIVGRAGAYAGSPSAPVTVTTSALQGNGC